ncbi:uncharacterized protein LOC131153782 [Malania oleifera]|uniref:uncharacterized protein LOC131153782 n=1 Tax=Malania oleifera TaxID=397392 RepID=UPI0025AE0113|nr:uncharacterized protein LOC131153782 [Malania oleifera]
MRNNKRVSWVELFANNRNPQCCGTIPTFASDGAGACIQASELINSVGISNKHLVGYFTSKHPELWTPMAFGKNCSEIGRPLFADKLTTNKDRLSCAQILVKVDIAKEVKHSVKSISANLGKKMRELRELKIKGKGVVPEVNFGKVNTKVDDAARNQQEDEGLGGIQNQGIKASTANKSKEVFVVAKTSFKEDNLVEVSVVAVPTRSSGNEIANSPTKDKGKIISKDSKAVKEKGRAIEEGFVQVKSKKKTKMGMVNNLNHHRARRILVLWNSQKVQLQVIDMNAQVIHCAVKCSIYAKIFTVRFVYDFNSIVASKQNVGPWLLLGDFNCAFAVDEKRNGQPVSTYENKDIKECFFDLGLSNLRSTSCHLTWSNGKVGCKLDRAVVNSSRMLASYNDHAVF